MGLDDMIFVFFFLMLSFKPTFSLSFTLIKSIFSSSSICTIIVIPSAYLRLLIFLPAVLIPACDSSSLAVCMVYSAQKLNKQDDSIYSCCTPFPIVKQSAVLTIAFWPAHTFLRWSGIAISLRIFQFLLIHTFKGFSLVDEAEVDVFLEFSCLFYNPTHVTIWYLIPLPFLNPACTSGSSPFMYCGNLVWTSLMCEMSTITQ